MASDRRRLYLLILFAISGAAIAAIVGVGEYLAHYLAGQSSWRTFGTSTPDYFAGYFVLLLAVTFALLLEISRLPRVMPLLRAGGTLILGVILLLQLASLLTTGSRFALMSLAIEALVFGASLWRISALKPSPRLLGIISICLALTVVLFAHPVLNRLHTLNDNSTAFRVWTWKGAAKMAAANPLLGTGIGTWPELYPRYAYTGFTRVAHDAYLQMADECGVPALLTLLATLGLLGVSLMRGLTVIPTDDLPAPPPAPISQSRKAKRAATPAPTAPPPSDFLPIDHRLLLCGLLAALAGGVMQNLIDSDWYIFFLGTTFWTLAGLAAGIADPISESQTDAKPAPKPILAALGSVAAALCALTATEGIAAFYAGQAQDIAVIDPAGAAQTYGAARAWDPLNGRYPSDQGYKVYYVRGGDLHSAEMSLRAAITLEPNSLNFRRLGTILEQGGQQKEALQAYQDGLRADPHSLDIILDLAHLTPLPHSLDYYQRLSDLEQTPVGTVRALGESTETKFAVADRVMGDEAAKTDPAQAIAYYARAATLLEKFADEGGSLNEQQRAMSGGKPNPNLDADRRGVYDHVLTAWIALVPADQRESLRQRQRKYLTIFDRVFAQSSNPGTL